MVVLIFIFGIVICFVLRRHSQQRTVESPDPISDPVFVKHNHGAQFLAETNDGDSQPQTGAKKRSPKKRQMKETSTEREESHDSESHEEVEADGKIKKSHKKKVPKRSRNDENENENEVDSTNISQENPFEEDEETGKSQQSSSVDERQGHLPKPSRKNVQEDEEDDDDDDDVSPKKQTVHFSKQLTSAKLTTNATQPQLLTSQPSKDDKNEFPPKPTSTLSKTSVSSLSKPSTSSQPQLLTSKEPQSKERDDEEEESDDDEVAPKPTSTLPSVSKPSAIGASINRKSSSSPSIIRPNMTSIVTKPKNITLATRDEQHTDPEEQFGDSE